MKKLFFLYLLVAFNLSFAQLSDFDSIDFTKANNIVKLNKGQDLKNLPLLSHILTSKLTTEAEKFRAIFVWVSKNISVDSNQGNKVLTKRKKYKNDSTSYRNWNEMYKKTTFKRLVENKKTMCTGYAYLIKELCFFADIECVIVDGYARTASTNTEHLELANHSWNAVKLKNKWYLCDAIWASGYVQNGRFVKDYNDGYFLADPLLFAQNHYPIDKKWLLNEELIESEFLAKPVIYGETFKYNIIPTYPISLVTQVKKGDDIMFKYKVPDAFKTDKVKLIQVFGKREHVYKINNLKVENGILSFNTKLKYKGYYDLHLKIENDIVTTYTFKVVE